MSGQPSPEGARSHRRMLMLQLEIQYLTHQFEACANVSRFCLECRPRSVEVKKQKPKGAEAGRGNSIFAWEQLKLHGTAPNEIEHVIWKGLELRMPGGKSRTAQTQACIRRHNN